MKLMAEVTETVMNERVGNAGTDQGTDLVLACCWATSKRVLSCSDTTPKARKPTHASPAPIPNRRVSDDATQSVESAEPPAARFAGRGLAGAASCACACIGCCCCGGGCSEGGWALGGREDGAQETWGLATGRAKKAGELPKKVAMAERGYVLRDG